MISLTPLIFAALAAAAAPSPGAPPVSVPRAIPTVSQTDSLAVEPGEGRRVAEKVATELLANFVLPDNAKDYAAELRRQASTGRYDSGTHSQLADRMTEDLLAIHKDGHLHVGVRQPEGETSGAQGGPPKNFPPLIQSAKWLAPGIAYIRPTAFMSTDEEVAAFATFMADHKDAKTIIFDMRNHHGGRLGEMDVVFPYLFAARTPLVKMEMARSIYDQHGSPFGDAPTLVFEKGESKVTATHFAIPGAATALRDAKVILLTSNVTGSAGEHFSLAMKSTGRATLIGEATAGANHFGGPAPVGDHFDVWMPVGRTYDPKTGKDWEGTGVLPDVAVDPRQALVVALEQAGLSKAEAIRIDATEVPAEPVHRDKLRAR